MNLLHKATFFVLGVFLFLLAGLQATLSRTTQHSPELAATSSPTRLTSDRLALPAASAPLPDSGNQGCTQVAPLFRVELPETDLAAVPVVLGEWRLPLSSAHPEIMTEARAEVRLTRNLDSKGHWVAHVTFHFPDPKPFGIPFSFQKVRLSWQSDLDTQTRVLVDEDWSDDCSGVGRSIFPGQKWSTSFELPGLEEVTQLKKLGFEVWGSRN